MDTVDMMTKPHIKRDPESQRWWLIVDGDCVVQHKSVEYVQGALDQMLIKDCAKAERITELALAWRDSGYEYEKKKELVMFLESTVGES